MLVGRPNVGKSTLFNRVTGSRRAIVTPVAGTTRDYVRAALSIDGVPIHIIDTAGLREAADEVERIGVERSRAALAKADAAVLVVDASQHEDSARMHDEVPAGIPHVRVENKIDLVGASAGESEGGPTIRLSARTGEGVELLRRWLLRTAGWKPHAEGLFMARRRHVDALRRARAHVGDAARKGAAFELKAEELRLAHRALGEITGEVSADALLGEIFSRFCIGK